MEMQKELRDIKLQADHVLRLIDEALDKIKSASNWGIYDVIAGGMVSSMIKRERMKESNRLMEEIGLALNKLKKEYGDIAWQLPERLSLDLTSELLDVWFDNIFTDLSVQSNLSKQKDQLVKLSQQVKELERLVSKQLS